MIYNVTRVLTTLVTLSVICQSQTQLSSSLYLFIQTHSQPFSISSASYTVLGGEWPALGQATLVPPAILNFPPILDVVIAGGCQISSLIFYRLCAEYWPSIIVSILIWII